MYCVYALKSLKDDRIYIGLTKNLDSRLKEHNHGKTKSTKYYRPWVVLYSENCTSRLEARNREKKLKSGYYRELFKNTPQ